MPKAKDQPKVMSMAAAMAKAKDIGKGKAGAEGSIAKPINKGKAKSSTGSTKKDIGKAVTKPKPEPRGSITKSINVNLSFEC